MFSFQNASAVYIFILLAALFSIIIPETFLTTTTWRSLLDTQVITALVAIGLCVPMATGVYDLSIGMTLGVGAVVSAFMLVNAGLPTPVAILIALATGALVGLVNGLIVTVLNVDSFITTLGLSWPFHLRLVGCFSCGVLAVSVALCWHKKLALDTADVERANRSNQRQTRAPAWLCAGLPEPHELHREIAPRSGWVQAASTPSIPMSPFRAHSTHSGGPETQASPGVSASIRAL